MMNDAQPILSKFARGAQSFSCSGSRLPSVTKIGNKRARDDPGRIATGLPRHQPRPPSRNADARAWFLRRLLVVGGHAIGIKRDGAEVNCGMPNTFGSDA